MTKNNRVDKVRKKAVSSRVI